MEKYVSKNWKIVDKNLAFSAPVRFIEFAHINTGLRIMEFPGCAPGDEFAARQQKIINIILPILQE